MKNKYLFLLAVIFLPGILQSQMSSKSESVFNSEQYTISNTDIPDWKNFVKNVRITANNKVDHVTIVHLGDSHIQGGYFPDRFRELLNCDFGISGRGWVFPYSYAKTNGPEDVKFRTKSRWTGVKYNHLSKGKRAHISGYHLTTSDSVIRFTLKLKLKSDQLFPFNELHIYHNKNNLLFTDSCKATSITEKNFEDFSITRIVFQELLDSVGFSFSVKDSVKSDFSLMGINLVSSKPGIIYHSIGVNGASFDAFNRSINYRSILRQLIPDLIIVSLGTNDAYVPHLDSIRFKQLVVNLIDSIQILLPGVCILLTTPGDHLKNRKFVNPNLNMVRDVIISTAIQKNCLYWDFLAVMGNIGSAKRWKTKQLMYTDMIHLSQTGYVLQGELFFDAFVKAINETTMHGQD